LVWHGVGEMESFDNVNLLLGDDIRQSMQPESRLVIAASCFSIYAFEALMKEFFQQVESLQFIYTTPTFVPNNVTNKAQR
jgi:hypothetical protein